MRCSSVIFYSLASANEVDSCLDRAFDTISGVPPCVFLAGCGEGSTHNQSADFACFGVRLFAWSMYPCGNGAFHQYPRGRIENTVQQGGMTCRRRPPLPR